MEINGNGSGNALATICKMIVTVSDSVAHSWLMYIAYKKGYQGHTIEGGTVLCRGERRHADEKRIGIRDRETDNEFVACTKVAGEHGWRYREHSVAQRSTGSKPAHIDIYASSVCRC